MFSKILKQLRKSKNISQEQLAKVIFVTPSAISQYETGHSKPSRENLERLAKFFDVSTDYLLGSSPIADLEEKMNQDYCAGVTVSTFVDKCMSVKGKHRETLLDVVEALELRSGKMDE